MGYDLTLNESVLSHYGEEVRFIRPDSSEVALRAIISDPAAPVDHAIVAVLWTSEAELTGAALEVANGDSFRVGDRVMRVESVTRDVGGGVELVVRRKDL